MARPLKQGVDYFPLDVHIDNKLKFIKIKYGVEGYGMIICLLQHIYSLSYWCSCTDDDVLLLSDEFKVDYDKLKNVIEEAIKREFFNKELYEKHSILTSKGIQKRYQEIVKRRKEVEVIEEYLVIDNNFGVNVNINEVNASTMQARCMHDVSKSTQSKVNRKETKEERKKDNNIIKDIVEYLNESANTAYRYSTKKTQNFINARINEGYTLEEFKAVIDVKSKEWLNTSQSKYLRPETLFGNKFESYLNQKGESNGINKRGNEKPNYSDEPEGYEGLGFEA